MEPNSDEHEQRRPSVEIVTNHFGYTDFKEMPWTPEVRRHIIARRAAMSGELFFDVLVKLGGVEDPSSIYPPHNMLSLTVLLDTILDLSYDSMKCDCLIYYLLKQLQEGKEVPFAGERALPPHYVQIMDAYWELDTGINLESAVSRLSDVRIVKENSSKIMDTLALDPNSAFLLRKYVRTSFPALTELKDVERYVIALAELSVMDAWKYQRSHGMNYRTRKALIRKILEWALTPKPKVSAIKQLLALPLVKFEEAILQNYASNPPEDLPLPSIEAARGLVTVRLIQICKFAPALRFDRQYPASPAAPRGTWGAERERIGNEILSIMHRSERDKLQNEINALDADARIRRTLGAKANTSQPRSSSSLGASSGSADLSASWEDLGRRGPRPSFSGRIRTSLANGSPSRPTARAAAASPSSKQPIPGQPTVASQNGAAPATSAAASQFAGAAAGSPLSAAHLRAQRVPTSPKANGAPSGAQKGSAARNRNAFFEVDETRTPSPTPLAARDSDDVVNSSPRHAQTSSPARLPTPPQEESDKTEEDQNDENQADEREEASSAASEDNAGDETIIVENNRSGFSFFGFDTDTPTPPTRLSPSSVEGSPSNRRKYDGDGNENQRKKPRISVPGAFVTEQDGDDEHEQESELPSPASATAEKPSSKASHHAPPQGTRRTTRKRSPSPEESTDGDENNKKPMNIPGALFKEEEEEKPKLSNGKAKADTRHTASQRNGLVEEDSEGADELAPLPPHRSTRKKAYAASAVSAASSSNLRTPRRTTRSVRGSSAEPDEPRAVPPSTGRPVRRSSRLQSVEVSPTAEHFNKSEPKKKEKEKEVRPKKVTRTTGTGATATGRGSSKRR